MCQEYEYKEYEYNDYNEENVDCSIYADDIRTIKDLAKKKCSEFANDGYRCVPFQACEEGEIKTDGRG